MAKTGSTFLMNTFWVRVNGSGVNVFASRTSTICARSLSTLSSKNS